MAKNQADSQSLENGFAAPAALTSGKQDYDPRTEARRLLRTVSSGALATIEPKEGAPVATLVSIATDFDGSPILLTSSLSVHSRNMAADPRVSLLLAERGKGDPLAHPRLTLFGRAAVATDAQRRRLRARFLSRHPKSALYADFADFSFWRVAVSGAHFNGGFAKAAEFESEALLAKVDDAEDLIAAEADALTHLNADHSGALALYAQAFAGEKNGRWRAVAIDPEGMDLASGDRETRVDFPRRVAKPSELRQMLMELARRARSATPSESTPSDTAER